jgi:hypothetical protein
MRVLALLRPTMARFAPRAASASAAAKPMPLVAPVSRICLSKPNKRKEIAISPRLSSARGCRQAEAHEGRAGDLIVADVVDLALRVSWPHQQVVAEPDNLTDAHNVFLVRFVEDGPFLAMD